MSVPGIIKDTWALARPDTRQHVGHHWPESAPGNDTVRRDMWELLTCPIDHRLDSVVADVFIEAIEFCSTCNPKAIGAEPACHDLCSIIQDTNLRRSFLTFRRVQVHRD